MPLNPDSNHGPNSRSQSPLVDYSPPFRDQAGFLRNLTLGFQLGQAFFTAHDMGIFISLTEARSLEEIAVFSRSEPEQLQLLLGMLVSGEVLSFQDGKYRIKEELIPFLSKDSSLYAGWIDYESSRRHRWMELDAFLREKKIWKIKQDTESSLSTNDLKSMGEQVLLGRLQGIVKILQNYPMIHAARNILDLGAGHGLIGIACAEVNPLLKLTIFDRPSIIPIAQEQVSIHGLEDRVTCIGGDYLTGGIGSGYDVILQICPSDYAPDIDQQVIGKIADALNAGGMYFRCGFFLDEDCTGPLISASFALSAEMQGYRRHRTVPEMDSFFSAAGMKMINRHDLSSWCDLPMYLLVCKKKEDSSSTKT